MSALAALIIVAAFGCLAYRLLPDRLVRAVRLDRYLPHSASVDHSESSYDYQRQYSDLSAIYARTGTRDPVATTPRKSRAPRAESRPGQRTSDSKTPHRP
ncbi:hypothetical protein [Nocardia callitridis]|uniref:Lipoprotein n=1 Tax=Nocardia callitridis TaxID=648753 RepID=A0ABP9JUL7_9NOCA